MAATYQYITPNTLLTCITPEKCLLAQESHQNAVTSLPPTRLPKTSFSPKRAIVTLQLSCQQHTRPVNGLLAKASHQKTETKLPPTHMPRKLASRQSEPPKKKVTSLWAAHDSRKLLLAKASHQNTGNNTSFFSDHVLFFRGRTAGRRAAACILLYMVCRMYDTSMLCT